MLRIALRFPLKLKFPGTPKLFSSCIVTLNSFSNNLATGVASLVELGLVRDRPYHVAGAQPERGTQCRQSGDEDTDDDFDDLVFAHNNGWC